MGGCMLCPYCENENSRVLESRTTAEKSCIRRRRECEKCLQRFTTYEKIEFAPLTVLKKNGAREEYSREKLLSSIINSANKCEVNIEHIELMIDKIELDFSIAGKREVTSLLLGEKVLDKLKAINEIAYIRYLSAFKRLKNLEELMNEINCLTKEAMLVK